MNHNNRKVHKLAIIGGGLNSAVGYTHLIASQMDHRFEIVSACFSSKLEKSHETAEAWNLDNVRTYGDWRLLLDNEKERIDAVAILTPTPQHYEMITGALKKGIPIISEKALASDYDEAKNICEIQTKTNAFLAVTQNYTGYPMVRELKALCESGNFGNISNIQIEMPQEGFIRLDHKDNKPCPQDWRLEDGKIPGVSLDLGVHCQHMIHYITGENPKEIIADQNTFGLFKDIIDDVSIFAKYPSGMKSTMWFSKSALGNRNGLKIRIFGTNGSAEWYQAEPEIAIITDVYGNITCQDRSGDTNVLQERRYNRFKVGHPAGFIEAFANVYVDIADKLDEYKENDMLNSDWSYGASQAAIGLSIFDAAVKSSNERSWIKFD